MMDFGGGLMKTLTVLMPQYICLQVLHMSSDIQCLYYSSRRQLALLIKMNDDVVSERTCMLYKGNGSGNINFREGFAFPKGK